MRRRGWILAVAACVACAPPAADEAGEGVPATPAEAPGSQGNDAEVAAVVAVVETILHAINTADSDLARSVVLPDARVTAVRESGWGTITGEDFAAGIGDPEQGYVERMWDPQVRVLQNVATVWAPYDFYLKGEFSHCGVDTVQLVLVDGAWMAQSLLYNMLQPPDCELHPEGPPG
jgi:hypothetical protein